MAAGIYKIYGLSSSEDNIIRYIGYTKRDLNDRLYGHFYENKGLKNHKNNWIKSNLNKGFTINIELIDRRESED